MNYEPKSVQKEVTVTQFQVSCRRAAGDVKVSYETPHSKWAVSRGRMSPTHSTAMFGLTGPKGGLVDTSLNYKSG